MENEESDGKEEEKEVKRRVQKPKKLKGGVNYCKIDLKHGYAPRQGKAISFKSFRTRQ